MLNGLNDLNDLNGPNGINDLNDPTNRVTIDETRRATLARPDIQGTVMESEAFISSENSCISTSRRTLPPASCS